MTRSFLSDPVKEIILGSLLGDGSLKLYKGYQNARFSFKHSENQSAYFFWKVGQLKRIASEKCVWRQEESGFGKSKLRFQSLALEELTDLYKLTCVKNKLAISRKWLNLLTPLALAVWWLDDGSIISNGRKGVICTDGFSYADQRILARYLKIVWNIEVKVGKIQRFREGKIYEYYRLWIRSTNELKKLLTLIMPFVKVEQMLPKIIILYKDSQLQQRWISEVSKLTGFSEEKVEGYVSAKKAKWQKFRE